GSKGRVGEVSLSQRPTSVTSRGLTASLSAAPQASDAGASPPVRNFSDPVIPTPIPSESLSCRQSKGSTVDRTTTQNCASDPSSKVDSLGGSAKQERGGNGMRRLDWSGTALSTADGRCFPLFQLFRHGWWATPIPPEDPPLDPDATEKLLPCLPSFPAVVYFKKDHCFFALWKMKDGVVHRRRSECALLGVREAHRQAVQTVCRLTRRPPGVVYDCKSGKWSVCVTRYNGRHRASFSVKKFGFEGAHEKAMEWYEAKRGQLGLHENPACAETVDFDEEVRQNPQALLAFVESAIDAAPPAQPVREAKRSMCASGQVAPGTEIVSSFLVGVSSTSEKVATGRSAGLWNSLAPALVSGKISDPGVVKQDSTTEREKVEGVGTIEGKVDSETPGEGEKIGVEPIQQEVVRAKSEENGERRNSNPKQDDEERGEEGCAESQLKGQKETEQQETVGAAGDVSPKETAIKRSATGDLLIVVGDAERSARSREGDHNVIGVVGANTAEKGERSSSAVVESSNKDDDKSSPAEAVAVTTPRGILKEDKTTGTGSTRSVENSNDITACANNELLPFPRFPAETPCLTPQKETREVGGRDEIAQIEAIQPVKAKETHKEVLRASRVTPYGRTGGTARSCSRSVTTAQEVLRQGVIGKHALDTADPHESKSEESEVTLRKGEGEQGDACCSLSLLRSDKTLPDTETLQGECQGVSGGSNLSGIARPEAPVTLGDRTSRTSSRPGEKMAEHNGHDETGVSSVVQSVSRAVQSSQDTSNSSHSRTQRLENSASSVSTFSASHCRIRCPGPLSQEKPSTTTAEKPTCSPVRSPAGPSVASPSSFRTPDSSSLSPPPSVSPESKPKRSSVTDSFATSAAASPAISPSASTEGTVAAALNPGFALGYLRSFMSHFSAASLPSTPALLNSPWKTKQCVIRDSFPTSPRGGRRTVADGQDGDDPHSSLKKQRPLFLNEKLRDPSCAAFQSYQNGTANAVAALCSGEQPDNLSDCQEAGSHVLSVSTDSRQIGDAENSESAAAAAHGGQMCVMTKDEASPQKEDRDGVDVVGDDRACPAETSVTGEVVIRRKITGTAPTTVTRDCTDMVDAFTHRYTAGGVTGGSRGGCRGEPRGEAESLAHTAGERKPAEEEHRYGADATMTLGTKEMPASSGGGDNEAAAIGHVRDKEGRAGENIETRHNKSAGEQTAAAQDTSLRTEARCTGPGGRRNQADGGRGKVGIPAESGDGRVVKKRRAREDSLQASKGKCRRQK
ncbi:ap2 domain transcription factor ap2viia-5, partial [Cystoisospora suis]